MVTTAPVGEGSLVIFVRIAHKVSFAFMVLIQYK